MLLKKKKKKKKRVPVIFPTCFTKLKGGLSAPDLEQERTRRKLAGLRTIYEVLHEGALFRPLDKENAALKFLAPFQCSCTLLTRRMDKDQF